MNVSKAEAHQRNLERLIRAMTTLRRVAQQPGVPRGVRGRIGELLIMLDDEKTDLGLRVANVISALDATSQDPDLPSFARVEIWSVISELEAIRE